MREEKKLITREYVERLNASPYFIVVNYEGLKVAQFEELRNRLARIYELAGEGEITGAAKTLKNFTAEFDKPKWHFGFLDNDRLDADQIKMLADLPSLDGMRAKLLGTLQAPAAQLVRTLIEPSVSLARIVRAKFGEEG